MNPGLFDLYHRRVAAAFDRQLRFADWLHEQEVGDEWGYDVPTGVLTLGKKLTFPAGLLGSHAYHNDSWLWAWANRNLDLPDFISQLRRQVKDLGHAWQVDEFATDGLVDLHAFLGDELIDHTGHVLGIVLGGELGYDAYYTLPYEGGQAVALIRDDRLRFEEEYPVVRMMSVFTQMIAALPVVDHRAALAAYAEAYGYRVAHHGDELVVLGADLTAVFDHTVRLEQFKSTVAANPAA